MTKPQLIESVSAATGKTKTEVEGILDAILDRTSSALAAGDRVELRGFGIFETKETKARVGGTRQLAPASKFRPATKQPFGPARSSRNEFR